MAQVTPMRFASWLWILEQIMRIQNLVVWVSLVAIWASGAPLCYTQPYYAISTHGSTFAGEMVVWQVEGNGLISQYWSVDTPSGLGPVHVDPFGRYAVFATEEDFQNYRLELWRIEPDYTMSLADVFHDDNLGFWIGALTQDGSFFVIWTTDISQIPFEESIRSYRITEDLEISPSGGTPQPISSESDLFHIADIAISDIGDRTVIASDFYNRHIYRLHMSPAGDIAWDGSTIALESTQLPGTELLVVRQDGRVAVTGLHGEQSALSLSINGSGEVSVLDIFDDAVGMIQTHFTPDGLAVIGGPEFNRIDLAPDGTFPLTSSILDAAGGALRAAVSPDGRLALFNHDSVGSTSRLTTVFSPSRGELAETGHSLQITGSWEDIEFIPPRTEEMLGDANADGLIDTADIVTYLNHFNDKGIYETWHPLSPQILGPVPEARADANQDGELTIDDLDTLMEILLRDQP
jgi:hypothetical protein